MGAARDDLEHIFRQESIPILPGGFAVEGQVKSDEDVGRHMFCQPVERSRESAKTVKAEYCVGSAAGVSVVDDRIFIRDEI